MTPNDPTVLGPRPPLRHRRRRVIAAAVVVVAVALVVLVSVGGPGGRHTVSRAPVGAGGGVAVGAVMPLEIDADRGAPVAESRITNGVYTAIAADMSTGIGSVEVQVLASGGRQRFVAVAATGLHDTTCSTGAPPSPSGPGSTLFADRPKHHTLAIDGRNFAVAFEPAVSLRGHATSATTLVGELTYASLEPGCQGSVTFTAHLGDTLEHPITDAAKGAAN